MLLRLCVSVDIIALDIHRVKQPEEIISDVYNYLSSSLSADQSKVIKDSYNNMVKDLGAEGANDALNRIKKIVIYAVSPAVEMVVSQLKEEKVKSVVV
ncbi:hypothetical protein DICVIV_13330 [Dictyocaulus viviparus]|uniref:Uncharacterized protein n=1 Tax=Dictyocaulus viviparus TaxID=29172 RepID=A0A0D8XAE5_DICVI|nr:hypothetical protein DICVIV_13330 [Dictyocaulus viviparus]